MELSLAGLGIQLFVPHSLSPLEPLSDATYWHD